MVRVVSCQYLRWSCSEDDHPLFRRHYTRSNRDRGVKYLRCFPHCCPEHVQRGYCGSSIHVQVTYSSAVSAATQSSLVVLARFEPSKIAPQWPASLADAPGAGSDVDAEERRLLQPGKVVALPGSLFEPAARNAAPTTSWIRADREGGKKQQLLSEDSVLYVLNNHRQPKWLYNYNSSISRARREMTHHLVVYVFLLLKRPIGSGAVNAAVLARHESPAFTFVSYRRSGKSCVDAGCDLPALDIASEVPSAAATGVENCRPSTWNGSEQDASDDLSSQESQSQEDCCETARDGDGDGGGACHSSAVNSARDDISVAGDDAMTDTTTSSSSSIDRSALPWLLDVRIHQLGVTEKAMHLLVLWRLLSCTPLSVFEISMGTLDEQMRPHWWRVMRAASSSASGTAAAAQLREVVGSLLMDLCQTSPPEQHEKTASHEQGVVQAAAQLMFSAVSSDAVRNAVEMAFAPEGGSMRDRFVALVLGVYDILTDLLRELPPMVPSAVPTSCMTSLPALVDDVLSVIYTHGQFAVLRAEVSTLLMGKQVQAMAVERLFRIFADQSRELLRACAMQNAPADAPSVRRLSGARMLSSKWSGRWLLEPSSIQVFRTAQGPDNLSLVQFVRWLHEFGCIDMALYRDNGESQVCVRSAMPVFSGSGAMELVLDGCLRPFHATPSGIASTIPAFGGWTIGDYAAVVSDRPNEIEVEIYAFVETSDSQTPTPYLDTELGVRTISARRIRLRLVLEEPLAASPSADGPDRYVVFHCTVGHATHAGDERRMRVRYADTHAQSRALHWTSLFEIQGGYVAVPAASSEK